MNQKHDLTTPEGRLANMLDFYTINRQKAQAAGLWFEVRYWCELPAGHDGTPSHWAPIAYAASRSSACVVAAALHRDRGWWCEVWTCNPVFDPDIPPESSAPVRWHFSDLLPDRKYPDFPERPSSGNPGENPSRRD